jgi:hypothetical protein
VVAGSLTGGITLSSSMAIVPLVLEIETVRGVL